MEIKKIVTQAKQRSTINANIKKRGSVNIKVQYSKSAFEETDPTVPAWAKEPTKPEYRHDEILDAPRAATDQEFNDMIKRIGGL